MTYESFSNMGEWDSVRSEEKRETCLTRAIDDFVIEMWRLDSSMQWSWAATRPHSVSFIDKSLFSPVYHKSLDISMSDCYNSLTQMGWMSHD